MTTTDISIDLDSPNGSKVVYSESGLASDVEAAVPEGWEVDWDTTPANAGRARKASPLRRATIEYSYVEGGEQLSASHPCTTAQAIAAAVDHLDAIEHDHGYAYRAEETGSWYAVTVDDMAEFGAAVLAGRASQAYSLWCAGCGEEIEDPTGAAVRCECGEATGERCAWSGPVSETVTVEWMPEHLRASHTAARNRGAYPSNGARRLTVHVDCADLLCSDGDQWCERVGASS